MAPSGPDSPSPAMRVRRLGWAGIEASHGDARLVVDLFEDASPLEPWVGEPHGPLPPPSVPGTALAALVTHLHADHADPDAIGRALAPGAPVVRPRRAAGEGLETIALAGAEAGLAELEVPSVELDPWESTGVGAFTVTALPAVDGFGDPQLSWAIEAGGTRIVHMGDTLFHGHWWLIAMRVGAIDAAFLPVNGPRVDLPHRQPPSPLPAVMDPEQAGTAAALLGAAIAVPIHFDTLEQAPTYVQTDDPVGRFRAAASSLGVEARVLDVGEELVLP